MSGEFYPPGVLPSELEAWFAELGEPRFRAGQLAHWLYKKFEFDYAAMKNLPSGLRTRLAAAAPLPRSRVAEVLPGSGNTVKLLVELADGEGIEMVLIPSRERMTFCLSTQVGCPVRCRFCASGQGGLVRNLRPDEMVEQLYWGIKHNHGELPDNVVFMGIGEGLLNFNALRRTLEIFTAPDGFGMSPRRITVSTSGYVPGMREFAALGREYTLAVSLHAVDDATRSRLIPDYCRYPLAEILAAADEYRERSGRMVTFEYTLIAGVNDSEAMAEKLAVLAGKHHAKVNLIACNPIGAGYARPEEGKIRAFARILETGGATVTVRLEKGASAAAACGQLRVAHRKRAAEAVGRSH